MAMKRLLLTLMLLGTSLLIFAQDYPFCSGKVFMDTSVFRPVLHAQVMSGRKQPAYWKTAIPAMC